MHTLIIDCMSMNFLLQLAVYALDGDGEVYKQQLMDANDIIAYTATNRDIKNIKIAGPTEYCLGLKDELENKLALEYAVNDIEIEVI